MEKFMHKFYPQKLQKEKHLDAEVYALRNKKIYKGAENLPSKDFHLWQKSERNEDARNRLESSFQNMIKWIFAKMEVLKNIDWMIDYKSEIEVSVHHKQDVQAE